jgi:hypothetical protein
VCEQFTTALATLVDVVDVAIERIDEFPKTCWRICPTYKHDLAATMKLRSTARGVLQKLRPKQTRTTTSAKTSKRPKTRYNVALTDPRDGDTTEEEPDSDAEPTPPREREQARRHAAEDSGTPGKEAHNKMAARAAIAIHEDPQYDLSTDQVEMEAMTPAGYEDGESVDDTASESSEYTEDEVDESVVEDMRRLEESFKGISQKYKLINRIGEGMYTCTVSVLSLTRLSRHLLHRVQSREAFSFGRP